MGAPGRAPMVKMYLLACALVSLAPLSSAMDLGRSGVYGSPMAQDFYVRRFGFLFGGGRSGMFGLKALQADGLVASKLTKYTTKIKWFRIRISLIRIRTKQQLY